MQPRLLLLLLTTLFFGALAAGPAAAQDAPALDLALIGRYETGVFDQGAAEIAAYDAATQRLFFVNADANSVVILDVSDPAAPAVVTTIEIDDLAGSVQGSANSVSVAAGLVAVAVAAAEEDDGSYGRGSVYFFDTDGGLLGEVTVGFLPDAVKLSPDGSMAVVANEGQPSDSYAFDPEGSISVIDLSGGVGAATVTDLGFGDFNEGGSRADELPEGVRIFGQVVTDAAADPVETRPATAAEDLEPEYVAFAPDGATAYVSLQENNAIAVVDVSAPAIAEIVALGTKDFSVAGNGIDPSDRDDAIAIRPVPVQGLYQPDALATYAVGDQVYILSANEGDARDYDAFSEEARVSDVTLDPDAFPGAAALQADDQLGRLTITTANGDTDGDGDFDELYAYGARSFSIWTADGTLVYDSGDAFEQITAERLPAYFNANNDDNDFDSRSDAKGPEPEAVTTGAVGGRTYAFVGLERIGGVMVYDVTDPEAPAFVTYVNSRDFTAEPEVSGGLANPAAGDLGPEDVVFVPAADSPTGSPLLIVANEISGSVALFSVRPMALPIADVRALPEDSLVTVEGVVTRARGRQFRLQDATAGITVFGPGGTLVADAIAAGDVAPGDTVRVTGQTGAFNDVIQLDFVESLERLGTGEVPAPQTVTLAEIAADPQAYESELIRITGLTIDVQGDATFQPNENYAVSDATDASGAVTLSTFGGDDIALVGEPIPDGPVTFTGVLGGFRGSPQLVPVEATDLAPAAPFTLTILHNSDGESQLLDAGSGRESFGGIARFASVVEQLRTAAATADADDPDGARGTILVSSGDNFLPGPELNASLELPDEEAPYDARGLDRIGYDAIAIGNHDFDLGPDFLARFITGFETAVPFLSANLDFTQEEALDDLVGSRIFPSVFLEAGGERIGLIGLTTPNLRFVSSPGGVVVEPALVEELQEEVDALEAQGINKIVVITHLQGTEEDLALIPEIRGIDVIVSGGGDELLANDDDVLIPGDEGDVAGAYPLEAMDADGNTVYVVSTPGQYQYVGRLEVVFDEEGTVIAVDAEDSGPVRVAGGTEPDAVEPDADVVAAVTEPVQAAVDALAENVVGTSEVALDGSRNAIRGGETNLGNLIADAFLWQAGELNDAFSAPEPDVALANGGGIRASIDAGPVTELETFDVLPFANFITIVEEVTAEEFKVLLENAFSRADDLSQDGTGRFAQVAGFDVTVDYGRPALLLDPDTDEVTQEGSRVRRVVLDDGTVLVQEGAVVSGAPAVDVATVDFLVAQQGDQYFIGDYDFTVLGVTYQQALESYIEEALAGQITAADYPEGGEGRITVTSGVSDEDADLPTAYALESNYPNPFNPSTTIRFALPHAGPVRLAVYDVTGRQVAVLLDGERPAGWHALRFDAGHLASGVYVYRLEAGTFRRAETMLLMK